VQRDQGLNNTWGWGAWGVAVIAVSIAVQLPIQFLLARASPGVDSLVQGAAGAAILGLAFGMRSKTISRRTRLWLSALGLIAFWGTIVAVVLTAIVESRRPRAPKS
jgi:hypothetical protein